MGNKEKTRLDQKEPSGPRPVDKDGEWEPHWVFVGEIIEVKDNE